MRPSALMLGPRRSTEAPCRATSPCSMAASWRARRGREGGSGRHPQRPAPASRSRDRASLMLRTQHIVAGGGLGPLIDRKNLSPGEPGAHRFTRGFPSNCRDARTRRGAHLAAGALTRKIRGRLRSGTSKFAPDEFVRRGFNCDMGTISSRFKDRHGVQAPCGIAPANIRGLAFDVASARREREMSKPRRRSARPHAGSWFLRREVLYSAAAALASRGPVGLNRWFSKARARHEDRTPSA